MTFWIRVECQVMSQIGGNLAVHSKMWNKLRTVRWGC